MFFSLASEKPAISRATGEFTDRDLERRFRLAVLPDWQRRLKINVTIVGLAYLFFVPVDYTLLGPSATFAWLLAIRAAVMALWIAVLVADFTPARIRLYDASVTSVGLAVGASFSIVIAISGYDILTAGVIMIGIVAHFYLFSPTRPRLALATAIPGTLGFMAVVVLSGRSGPGDQTALATLFFIFNAVGMVNALRVARLERQRFVTRMAERRMLARMEAQSLEIARARDEAEAANRAKSDFLAHMSHELRTPLNAINGFSEVIRDELFGTVSPAIYREYAADIHRSGQHLTALIGDVLDLSKIEAGKLEPHDETVVPADAVSACLRLVMDRAHQSGLNLRADLPLGLPHLRADGRMVKQILLNLLTNAIKFTLEGGEVTVRTRRPADGGLTFEVQDTGIGIARADLPNVTKPYGQVARARGYNPDGTGLGLPLVKKMAELHGGSLDLDSRLGIGTVATVTFPEHRVIPRRVPVCAAAVFGRAASLPTKAEATAVARVHTIRRSQTP